MLSDQSNQAEASIESIESAGVEEVALTPIPEYVNELVTRAKGAASRLATLSTAVKNRALLAMAEALEQQKDAILAATSAEVVEEHGAALDRLTAPLTDDAEVIAICVRHTARTVDVDPLWAWFAVRVGLFEERIEAGLGPRLARDVRRGMEHGRFPRGNVELLSRTIGAAVAAVLRGKLAGELGADTDRDLGALVLRILGIAPAEAHAIANRPLPARDTLTTRKGEVA